jgi:ubiquinone/menaquinone biosynthesis C-methylase UbiE
LTSHEDLSEHLEDARRQSKDLWDAMAPGWHERRGELWHRSRPVGEWMIRKLDPQPADTVLELAAALADTGFMAAPLVGESGRVIVTDFAPEMVSAARRRAEEVGVTNAHFRVLDAERMDLETDSVDGVLCRWGYMLMIDPVAALAETRRVLRPGGRLAFSVFGAPDRNAWASLVGGVLVRQGHIPQPDPAAPSIFAMADPRRVREMVVGAGFAEPEIEEVSFSWAFVDRDDYWRFLLELVGAIASVLRGLPPEAREQVREQVQEAAEPYRTGEGYDFPAVCLNVATR